MVTGTFTHSSERAKILKTFTKTYRRVTKIFNPRLPNVLSTATNNVKHLAFFVPCRLLGSQRTVVKLQPPSFFLRWIARE